MFESRVSGSKSARVYFLLVLTLLIDRAAVQKPARLARDINSNYEEGGGGASNYFKNSLVITPKFTGLDCDFGLDRDCLWTWDADNFTSTSRTILPGQNGFYRMNGDEVRDFHDASSKSFFGPTADPKGSNKGMFLYLLGKPMSDVANFTDKRLISSLIRESGNNCTVEIKLMYQNVRGAIIEFGTQNSAKAYSPIADITFMENNQTTTDWKSFHVRYGRYIDPFSISIDVKRSRKSFDKSFLAIADIKLINCEPESSIPINCTKKPSRNYNCPGGGLGSPCLDGPSMLCDLKPDCPNGGDEKEEICFLMPPGSRCDFNKENDFCGWRDPNHFSLGRYENNQHQGSRGPFRIAAWQQKKGKTNLDGIKGDLSQKNDGYYLYVSYESGQNGLPGSGATLRSPVFPPPPAYNSNNSSEYYKSCRIRLSYHTLSSSLTPAGPLDLIVNFVKESSNGKVTFRQIHLTLDVPMRNNRDGWIRWEAPLPENMQLRYYFTLVGSNGFGSQAELAVDDLSLSPQCFGLGVSTAAIGSWRYNMTDLELCQYYGRTDCTPPKKTYGFEFSTCNIFGPLGPMQEDCIKDYAGTSTSVLIGDDSKTSQDSHQLGYVTGIQRWNVPVSGIYTIIAGGASGARGRENKVQSHGDEIRALIRLEANETVFVLVGQMGSSCEGGQCGSSNFGDHRQKRSVNDKQEEFFYDLLQDEAPTPEIEEEEEEDNMYGHIVFTPFGSEAKGSRHRRSVPALMPARSVDTRRSDGKPVRGDSIKEIARIMALSDGSTLPSTRLEPGEEDRVVNEEDGIDDVVQGHVPQQQQPTDDQHGRIHDSPDTMRKDDVSNIDRPVFNEGGGGGGGATFIFRFVANGSVQPLLIAAGGGGSSDQTSSATTTDNRHNARGLVNPWIPIENLLKLVSQSDVDAGSGGGWNSELSFPCNFSMVYGDWSFKSNKTQSTGFTMSDSWMGGLPCSPNSQQWGGFGGGGAGCHGGGGGGGYIGGHGGVDHFSNGEGGWSYFNPDAVLRVLDVRMNPTHSVLQLSASGSQPNGAAASLPHLWTNQGQGQVHILPPLPVEHPCQSNCSAFGATCVILDPEAKKLSCVCPNGILLDAFNPKCSDELPLFVLIVIAVACIVTMAILGLLCMFLYTQYQRKHMQMLRRKMMSGPVVEGQLNRLRAMNINVNGVTMTEYNPNYEFGGGTCTLQDLREIPRENLRLIKALGQGAFGEVYQGFYKKSSSDSLEMSVAVKTLPELSSNQAEMDFLMEALIMSKFNHPNIVHFIGVCFEKHPRFIVLELLAGGDLKTFLRDSRPKPDRASPLVMRDLLLCAIDVAKGCEYLESNHFIHRDIAARNCLLTSKGPDRVAKIADFGMARDIYRGDYYRKGGKAMLPVKWMPPEAFLDGIFTSKTDVWSFGILLWEVMSLGYMPYPGRGNQEVMQLVTNGGRLEPPNYCPGPVYGLMCQCWHPIPEERPNFRTILERLGYCIQDPEVVMAPLPVFHRPMTSLENSRETSLSSGRGGGATTGSSADSGSGFSLPMRGTGIGGKGRPAQSVPRANMTPDSPGTTVTLAGASSSDYLVPLAGMPTRPAGQQQPVESASHRKSSRESIPASSPSDVPASENEDEEMLLRRPSSPLTGEAETSFSCPAPSSTSVRRSGGYTSLPTAEGGKARHQRRRRPSGSSSNKKLQNKSLSRSSINQIPPGSSSSSTSSCEAATSGLTNRPPRSRLASASHPLEPAIEPPRRTTSVIASQQLDSGPPSVLPLAPPPPRGYSDSSPSNKDELSPILPPLPPLPDEASRPSAQDKLSLDVASLRSQHRLLPSYINMDATPTIITNPTPYIIHASSASTTSSNGSTSRKKNSNEPPSEISV